MCEMSAPDYAGMVEALAPEDALRAELNGLLAHMFAAGPRDEVLRSVAASPVEIGADGDPLCNAWRDLKPQSPTDASENI